MSERVSIPGPAGNLEVLIEAAAAPSGAAQANSYAVICHPHPLYGGTMDNKVVTTLARALHEVGIPSLRFNFRGVGASDGSFDQGNGETADAEAVAAYGAARWPGSNLVVQGDADEVVDPEAVISWARGLVPPPRLVILQGVGHFFHEHLHELRDAVIESIRSG